MLPFFEAEQMDIRAFYTNNLCFPKHLQQSLELVYCEKGEVSLFIDDRICELQEGDLAVIFPNTIHSYLQQATEEKEGTCLVLISSLKYYGRFSGVLSGYQPEKAFINSKVLHPDVIYAMKGIYAELHAAEKSSYSDVICHAFMELLLSRILKELHLETVKLTSQKELTRKIMMYVGQHFKENLSLEILASELNISRYYLSHVFSTKLKTSFPSYVNEFRLNHALSMIHSGETSITELWMESGFESERTFHRVFRNKLLVSPREYMNQRNKTSEQEIKSSMQS